MVGTALTVAVAFVDLGALNNVIMLTIAMRQGAARHPVLHARALEHAPDLARRRPGFFWLLILFSVTMTDFLTRGWVGGTLRLRFMGPWGPGYRGPSAEWPRRPCVPARLTHPRSWIDAAVVRPQSGCPCAEVIGRDDAASFHLGLAARGNVRPGVLAIGPEPCPRVEPTPVRAAIAGSFGRPSRACNGRRVRVHKPPDSACFALDVHVVIFRAVSWAIVVRVREQLARAAGAPVGSD